MRFALALLFLAIVAGPGFAQDDTKKTTKKKRPDFSGLWKVDTSNIMGTQVSKAEGAASKKERTGKEEFSYSTLFIEHHDPELKVIEKSVHNPRVNEKVIYFTDGRRETNTKVGGKSVDSKTKWDGKQLVTTVFRKAESGKESNTIIVRITWELSKDGNKLTTIWKPVDPRGGPQSMERLEYLIMTSKTVYQRVQN